MKKQNILKIQNLYGSVAGKDVLVGASLTVRSGEIHALMGPNGSGKSTLAYLVAGHPLYEITNSKFPMSNDKPKSNSHPSVKLNSVDLLALSPDERAKAGIFLAFQTPVAIPGVTVVELLRTAFQEQFGRKSSASETVQNPVLQRRWNVSSVSASDFMESVASTARTLRISETLLRRGIHDGFSGGEKKKIEMLTALILKPKFAIFDEIDTGLDVDALRVVAEGCTLLRKMGTGVLIITHYQRILRYAKPDFVHVFIGGRIVESGGAALATTIEKNGYKAYEN